jgi:hypothetical protein
LYGVLTKRAWQDLFRAESGALTHQRHARPGTLVGIKYLGKGHSKASGKTYNRYEVVAQDPLPVVDAAELL